MNEQIRRFEDMVIDLFNTSPLEPEIKRLVAQNVLNLITKVADAKIVEELREEKKNGIQSDSLCE